MEIKCGKCKELIDTDNSANIILDEENIGIRCKSCFAINRVAKRGIKEEVENLPTQIINPIDLMSLENGAAIIPAWLIVHDEKTKTQKFPLQLDKNSIGRKSSLQVDVAIETNDLSMSRNHAIIDVRLKAYNIFEAKLIDNKSTNGTIINGKIESKLNENEGIILQDGDTIQLGDTNLVIKIYKKGATDETILKEVKTTSILKKVFN